MSSSSVYYKLSTPKGSDPTHPGAFICTRLIHRFTSTFQAKYNYMFITGS